MISIDAIWEKRNLGVTAIEFEFSSKDTLENISTAIANCNSAYAVAKVPVCTPELYALLGKYGFTFAEAMMRLCRDISPVILSPEKAALNKDMAYAPMQDSDFDLLFSQIRVGMFQTDRIALDPHFGPSLAAKRYIGWIEDDRNRGNCFQKLLYQGNMIGFLDGRQNSDTEYQDVLYGLFPEYTGKGLAFAFTSQRIPYIQQRGGTHVLVDISANNINSLQSRLRYGFNLQRINYVFVKHSA